MFRTGQAAKFSYFPTRVVNNLQVFHLRYTGESCADVFINDEPLSRCCERFFGNFRFGKWCVCVGYILFLNGLNLIGDVLMWNLYWKICLLVGLWCI